MKLLKCLCDALLMSDQQILQFAVTAPHRYKKYEIAKRNSNKKRMIAHPSRELKLLQRVLLRELESILLGSESSFAYVKGKGIRENALRHSKSRYLLKMDFKDFFPSINPEVFFKACERAEITFDENDKFLLANLLFWRPKRNQGLVLSIGAPTSPLISNFIMSYFDKNVASECGAKRVNYTRYADDLTFSTNLKNVLFAIPELVSKQLSLTFNDAITINPEKTVFTSKAHNRHVTGVTITNEGKLSVGRQRKRFISAMIHRFSTGQLSEEQIQKLKGYLAFASHIDSDFLNQMRKKYSPKVILELKKEKP